MRRNVTTQYLDKEEHYTQLKEALSKIANGEVEADKVSQFAHDALSTERVNDSGLTLDQFLSVIREAGEDDQAHFWMTYWADEFTPADAILDNRGSR